MEEPKRQRCCAVCGDLPAKIHYGVLACFGCKGFFRRAVREGRNKYQCRLDRNCAITKDDRNSCRYCRFRRCLHVGMDPNFVRPDRENVKDLKPSKLKLMKSNSIRVSNGSEWTADLDPLHRRLLSSLSRLECEVQCLGDVRIEELRGAGLVSLLSIRTIDMKETNGSTSKTLLKQNNSLLAIEKIVHATDFIVGFTKIFENHFGTRIGTTDRCLLVAESVLHLNLLDAVARVLAKDSAIAVDEFQSIIPDKFVSSKHAQRFAQFFGCYSTQPPSVTEFSMLRAMTVLTADASLFTNAFRQFLTQSREILHEIFYRVILATRRCSPAQAACTLARMVSYVYESRELVIAIKNSLANVYDRNSPLPDHPCPKIIGDILHPQVNDPLQEMQDSLSPRIASSNSNQISPINYPQIVEQPESSEKFHSSHTHEPAGFVGQPIPQQTPSVYQNHSSTHYENILAPTSTWQPQFSEMSRPNGLSLKIPLHLTKSIEEILRVPGFPDDLRITDLAGLTLPSPAVNIENILNFFPEYNQPL